MSTTNAKKIAIITGGSRGIGRATVLLLAQRGIRSIFTFQSRQDAADEVVAETEKLGVKAVALQLDAGKVSDFDAFVEKVKEVLSGLGVERFDYLVNNAGHGGAKTILTITEEELDGLYNVHFKGTLFLTQKLYPIINDGGSIVNISTGLARFTPGGFVGYAAMKAAIEQLSKTMAVEFGPRKIRVNVVAPGALATDFGGGFIRDNEQVKQHIASGTALGRVGEAQDAAGVIVGVLSDDFGWVNAQRIEVAGGIFI